MIPQIIAHRGASADAPENTIEAFQLAIEQRADGIELDIQLSSDKQPMVIHDETLDRTTQGTGQVRALTAHQLGQLNIPTLEEVIEMLPETMMCYIELKHADALIPVAECISKYKSRIPHLAMILPNDATCQKAYEIYPEIPRVCHFGHSQSNCTTIAENWQCEYLSVPWNQIDEAFIKEAKQHQLKLLAWTVNDVQTATRLKKEGVDGIITDMPSLLQETFAQDYANTANA